jgi:hypothetical protein
MKKYNSLKNEQAVSVSTCGLSGNVVYYVIIACTILLFVFIFGINKRLSNVKSELNSCRSSMRSDIN